MHPREVFAGVLVGSGNLNSASVSSTQLSSVPRACTCLQAIFATVPSPNPIEYQRTLRFHEHTENVSMGGWQVSLCCMCRVRIR